MAFAVAADIGQIKPFRHLEIKLNRTALPGASDGIAQVKIDLGAIKRAVALVDCVRPAIVLQGFAQGGRSRLPLLLAPHRILRTRGQLQEIVEAKYPVDTVDQIDNAENFRLNLVGRHKDMRVVLGEAAHTHQTVQRAGKLMPVYNAKLRKTLRQIAVGIHAALIDQNAAWTVHRLDRIVAVVNLRRIHIIFIMIPVTGAVPQLFIEDERRADLLITVLLMLLAPEALQEIAQDHAFGEEEWETRPFLIDIK